MPVGTPVSVGRFDCIWGHSMKATCRNKAHGKCSVFIATVGRDQKDMFIKILEWLAIAAETSTKEHADGAVNLKRHFGVKVRPR